MSCISKMPIHLHAYMNQTCAVQIAHQDRQIVTQLATLAFCYSNNVTQVRHHHHEQVWKIRHRLGCKYI